MEIAHIVNAVREAKALADDEARTARRNKKDAEQVSLEITSHLVDKLESIGLSLGDAIEALHSYVMESGDDSVMEDLAFLEYCGS